MDELRGNCEIEREERSVDLRSPPGDLLQRVRRMKSASVSLLVIVFPSVLSAFFCAKGGRSIGWEM